MSPTRSALLTGPHFGSHPVARSLPHEKTSAHWKSGTSESRSSLQNWEKSFSSRDLPSNKGVTERNRSVSSEVLKRHLFNNRAELGDLNQNWKGNWRQLGLIYYLHTNTDIKWTNSTEVKMALFRWSLEKDEKRAWSCKGYEVWPSAGWLYGETWWDRLNRKARKSLQPPTSDRKNDPARYGQRSIFTASTYTQLRD